MPLNRQNVPFLLTNGVNDKVSDKLLQGNVEVADNIRMQKSGIIEKRFGVQALGANDSTGNPVTNFEKLGSLDNELLGYANGSLYSYANSLSSWFLKGSRAAVNVQRDSVIQNAFEQSVPSIATKSGTTIIAWEDARGGVRTSVVDDASGQAFINDLEIDSTATRPKCLAVGNTLVLFYVDASNVLQMVGVSAVNPTGFGSPIIVGTCNATGFYDVVSRTDSQGILVHSTSAGTQLRFAYILSDSLRVGSSIDGVPNPQTTTALNPTSALNAFISADGNIWSFYYNSSNGVYYQGVTSNSLAPNLVETQINASTTDDVFGGFAIYEKAANEFTVIYDRDATDTNDYRIVKVTVNSAGSVVSAEAPLVRSLSLISKAFNDDYFIAGYKSTNGLQDTYFLLDTSGKVASRFSATVAGGHLNKAGMNVAAVETTSGFSTVAQVKTRFTKDEGEFFNQNGVDRINLAFSTEGVLFQQIGKSTNFTGGIISDYDGNTVVEHNFNYYPENIQASETTGGALTPLGAYSFIVIYQWEDSKGQLHRSTTSIPTNITLTGGNNQVDLVIPTLRVTDKENVTIEVYGTTANGATYYRLTPFNNPLFNDTTVDSVTYNVTASDASIQDNELLYTTGNVLDNSAPPAAQAITSFQNRLWLGALEEANKVWYSKELVDGNAIEFSEALQINIDPRGGRVKAIFPLDDKLVVFKETDLFVITGTGPEPTGFPVNPYSVNLITSDVGTVDANTIVSMEQGLMFKTRKGIYLLNRGLQVSYLGAPVENLNDLNMTAAVLIEDANEVRFLHSDGACAVYNYYFGQWYTFSNYEARGAINVDSTFYKISEGDRVVEREVPGYYGDRLSPIIMTIQTGWFSFGGINGFKRVYEMQTVGDYNSKHSASVILSYDFVDSEVERFDWSPGTNKAYGEESPYGSETYGGGSNNNSWFYRFKPQRQKCTSIKVKIQDRYPDSNLDKGFEINGINFLVGVKAGLRKPRTSGRTIR